MTRVLRSTAGVLCASLLLITPAVSQTFYGSIVGVVTDRTGSVLAGATITLTHTATSERRAATSADDGSYRFVNLIPGLYKLEIDVPGFRHYVREDVEVNVEAAVRNDVKMDIGSVTQTVEVRAGAPQLQTEGASLGEVVASRSVDELPLNGRNILNLVSNVAGVVPQGSTEGSLTGKNVFSAGNYQIGGGTANQSATYFDGVPVNDGYGNIVALTPTPDAVSEFKVQTNSNDAEYGRFTGGVINLTSRSGSNEFHGTAYEYHRDKLLNANNFFANRLGRPRAPFVQNQFGAALGGPIWKDHTFFYGNYEGYRNREGRLFTQTVPTAAELHGDFSAFLTQKTPTLIYDPLTQCGAYANPACTAAQLAGTAPQRQPFPGNVIPANRINPVAQAFIGFPYFALPTDPGFVNNFNRYATVGGNNDQVTVRGDQNVSDKQRLFVRYTRWESRNPRVDVYGNGQAAGDPQSPEHFVTTQPVIADTYTFNPTTVLDIRIGFMRWFYDRVPGNIGINIPAKLLLPASPFGQLPQLNGVPNASTVPALTFTSSTYQGIGTGLLYARDNTFVISPTLNKIWGRHSVKFGAELRRADINYYQNNNVGGTFTFTNVPTASAAGKNGGDSFASFPLGIPFATNSSTTAGTLQISPFTAGGTRYQGYYVNDNWQATRKLTVNAGLRWEIPGVYTERHDWQVNFDPNMINPALAGTTNPATGQPFRGGFTLVNTPQDPQRGLRPERFHLFAPRAGLAYRLTESTVLRAGGGTYYVPSTVNFPEGPTQAAVDSITNNIGTSQDNGATFRDLGANGQGPLNNPFPSGISVPPFRNPNFNKPILGTGPRAPLRMEPFPGYTEQWNLAIEHQFQGDLVLEAAYSGLHGVHEPISLQLDQLPLDIVTQARLDPNGYGSKNPGGLLQQVANPFFGIIPAGPLSAKTVTRATLLQPYPEYTGLLETSAYQGETKYHALELRAEKRFRHGGTLSGNYTFSKVTGNAETLTSWLETGQGVAGYQTNNLHNEWALSSFDARQRAVIAYALDLPLGRGQYLLPNVAGVLDKLISGWIVDGDMTFQEGFPLAFGVSQNNTGFGISPRPILNSVSATSGKSCTDHGKIEGSAQSRLNSWFDIG
ncbi:MAG: TonB-dependent receptor, partial [Deltaproteobacteria bacterium]|nr:TonB-dependent receptor [Deltaproteobacteria bacterium]